MTDSALHARRLASQIPSRTHIGMTRRPHRGMSVRFEDPAYESSSVPFGWDPSLNPPLP